MEEKSWRCLCLCVPKDTEAPLQSRILRSLFPLQSEIQNHLKETFQFESESLWEEPQRAPLTRVSRLLAGAPWHLGTGLDHGLLKYQQKLVPAVAYGAHRSALRQTCG